MESKIYSSENWEPIYIFKINNTYVKMRWIDLKKDVYICFVLFEACV